jgi:hypothetical protein
VAFLCRLLLRGRFSRKLDPALHERRVRASVPNALASPLGKGQSSPAVNVLWGTLNLAIGCLLVGRVGEFHLYRTTDVLALGVRGLLMAVMLARLFERIYGGQ